MEAYQIDKCTKCGESLDDLKIIIRLNIETIRKTFACTWEKVANMNIQSNEVLCKECFDKFADGLNKVMNESEDENKDEDEDKD